ncbi:MAG: neutral zinc metallopeptidase [Paracoccaceae bacterium]
MRWQGREQSDNIEDRRRMGVSRGGAQVGGVGLLAIIVIGYFLGFDVTPLLNGAPQIQSGGGEAEITEADQRAAEFVSVTLRDTEKVWTEVLRDQRAQTYQPVTLVLFKGATGSACGGASEATGPFYCPNDKKVYLDTGFFTLLEDQLGAGGDFAQAYVVAHEVGHYVQDELGILGKVNALRQRSSEADANALSVRIELQADCYSGVWARYAADRLGTLEQGDIAEAMNAAERIGDDTLQRNAGRRPMPDSFTHGTSEQRQRWFAIGYKSGDIETCDTFGARDL